MSYQAWCSDDEPGKVKCTGRKSLDCLVLHNQRFYRRSPTLRTRLQVSAPLLCMGKPGVLAILAPHLLLLHHQQEVFLWGSSVSLRKLFHPQGPGEYPSSCHFLQPGWEGIWGRMDTCICMAESLQCSPETTTTLLISCGCCSVLQ